LECHGLLKAGRELLRAVVSKGVDQADAQVGDLAQGILGAHVGHHVRGRPHLFTSARAPPAGWHGQGM